MGDESRFAFVPAYWLLHRGLSATDKAVLAVLATYASKTRYAFPSVKTMAEALDMSERTVRYSLRALEEIGAVLVRRRTTTAGHTTSNGYWITGFDRMPDAAQDDLQDVPETGTQCQETLQPIAAPPATGCTPPCNPLHPNSTSEQGNTSSTREPEKFSTIAPAPAPTPEALTLAWTDPAHAMVAGQYRRAARIPMAVDAALHAIHTGMQGPAVPLEILGTALVELAATGEPFNPARLRSFVRRLQAPPPPDRPAAAPSAPQSWDDVIAREEAAFNAARARRLAREAEAAKTAPTPSTVLITGGRRGPVS